MPSAKVLEEKKQIVAELTEKLKNAASGVIVDYKGINVEQDTNLRKSFREAGVEYSVIKNTLLRFAVKEAGLSELENVLEGTTALAISNDDEVAPAKVFKDFLKDNAGLEIGGFKAGFSDGKVLSVAEVEELANIPSREVLITKVACGLNSIIASLAFAIKAVSEKEPAEETPAEETAAPAEEAPVEAPVEAAPAEEAPAAPVEAAAEEAAPEAPAAE